MPVSKASIIVFSYCVLLSMWGCKKSNPGPSRPLINYTAGMGGTRTWHYVDSTNMISVRLGIDTVIYATQSFALTVVNDTLLLYPSGTGYDSLYYVSTDSVAGDHFFSSNSAFTGTWQVYSSIRYYYAADSIVFRSHGGGPGSTWSHFYDNVTNTSP